MTDGTLVVDSSAVISMLLREPDAQWFVERLAEADERLMSAGTVQEYLLVASSRLGHARPGDGRDLFSDAWQLVGSCDIRVVPVTRDLAVLGASAVTRYRGAPARLNFGDGFSYALARSRSCPILCKGDDFVHTDVDVVRPA